MINVVTVANYSWLNTTQQDIWFVYVFVSAGRKTIRLKVELSLMRVNTRIRRDINYLY